ncbi:uncharacterized protein [Mytilus edulis]|uniref:uncharacterized protein n=1 Tax=Mytilus edulis TaxID=6550 RepID=UPI0039F0E276
MGDSNSLFMVIPLVLIVKICCWGAICYRIRWSNRSGNEQTTIIHRTVIQGPVENGITGIENPGYLQQPLVYTDAISPNPRPSSVLPSNEQMTKAPYYPEQYNPGASRY